MSTPSFEGEESGDSVRDAWKRFKAAAARARAARNLKVWVDSGGEVHFVEQSVSAGSSAPAHEDSETLLDSLIRTAQKCQAAIDHTASALERSRNGLEQLSVAYRQSLVDR